MSVQYCVGILTLGCKVNQYESEAIAEKFTAAGFRVLSSDEECDVYIINTCTVTAESDRKARQFIRRAIAKNPFAYIIVTGCFAQTQPKNVAGISGVDAVCGNDRKLSVVETAMKLIEGGSKAPDALIDVGDIDTAGFEAMSISHFDRTRAYIKIEDGCESRCSYCEIPLARGKIRSKPREAVLREVKTLTDKGCREIVLTGIETGSWGEDLNDGSFADLLASIDEIPGIGRVRLGSLDPAVMRPDFVNRIASLHSLAPHFHLSMQSGSSRILALMRRKYNAQTAYDHICALREAIPGVMFTTDIITGFPGETDADFAETIDFVKRTGFLMIHIFPYSKRAGTPAARMTGQVPENIKRERAAELAALEAGIRLDIHNGLIARGKPTEVLFESFENGYMYGHTPEFVEVRVKSDKSLHALTFPVVLTETDGNVCTGIIINEK